MVYKPQSQEEKLQKNIFKKLSKRLDKYKIFLVIYTIKESVQKDKNVSGNLVFLDGFITSKAGRKIKK